MGGYLTGKEGNEIYYKLDKVEDSKASIIINHGFAEHLNRYDYMTSRLNKRGYSVYRYDLRGHGRSGNTKGHINSYKDFLDDSQTMIEFMKSKGEDNIFMLGHSMGGLITLLYGIQFPDILKGQIFSGAAVGILPSASGYKSILFKFANKFLRNKMIKNPVTNDICSDPQVVREYINDPLVLKEATLNFYVEFLVNGIDNISKNMNEYKYPCLITHGEKDKIVPQKIASELYNSISSKDKEIKIYENLYHEILNESVKDKVIDDMIDWLGKRV